MTRPDSISKTATLIGWGLLLVSALASSTTPNIETTGWPAIANTVSIVFGVASSYLIFQPRRRWRTAALIAGGAAIALTVAEALAGLPVNGSTTLASAIHRLWDIELAMVVGYWILQMVITWKWTAFTSKMRELRAARAYAR